MVKVSLRGYHGVALLGLLVLGIMTPGPQRAQAQSRPFPVTEPRTGGRPPESAAIRSSYGKLPLSFERNQGQAPSDVRYLARGQGYNLALTPTEARFTLQHPASRRTAKGNRPSKPSPISDTLRMQLAGASVPASVRGRRELPGKVNYLFGRDASRWRTDISTFREVSYAGVYPGVDLVYYGNQKQLEYDFIVAPRADPSRIALKFEGARRVAVEKTGDLVVGLPGGSVRWHKPVVYQQVNGARKPVAGRYVLKGAGQVGFALARYDVHRPLVIDPVLIYSTYIGGSDSDEANSIAIDSAGNAYIVGTATSPDFPGAGNGQVPLPGTSEGFITKINAAGSGLVYSTYIGGTGDTNCWGIAVDATGSAYVAGDTTATNLPVVHAFSSTNSGGMDAYVSRLNPAGNGLVYSTYLGGSGSETAQAIALGPNGNAYVTGYTDSTDFPASTGLQTTLAGGKDAFVARINTAVSGLASLVYSSYLGGGTGDDRAFAIAVDRTGRFAITGDTASGDFPVFNAFQATLLSTLNAFVTVFSADGSVLSYSTFLGGEGSDQGFGITFDASGNLFVTGTTSSISFPNRNAFQSALGGLSDAFIAKISPAAVGDASLDYSTFLGGGADDAGRSIAVDVWGNAYVAGDTDSNFSPFNGSDPFVAKIGVDGSTLLFGALVGGSGFEANTGIAIDPAGTAYITGFTNSLNFPVVPGALQPSLAGVLNAFIIKLPTFAKLDFNHDGQTDFVFQDTTSLTMIFWEMNGDRATRIDGLSPNNNGANWHLAATADLNGDNNTDLVFQNSSTGDMFYWLMNGIVRTSVGFINPRNPGPNWNLAGMGDFNRDGFTDMLFQNSQTGDLMIWNMAGTNRISVATVSPVNLGTGWKVVAVGDLNGDGQPDILFQQSNGGNLFVWFMHGATMFASGYLDPANPGPGWNVAGLADVNGDGQPEILFQNVNTGIITYWVMNGTSQVFAGQPRPNRSFGPTWKIAGLH